MKRTDSMLISVDENIAGKMLREFLFEDIGVSIRQMKRLKFTEGAITVNGEFVTVRYVLREGDVLFLAMEDDISDVSPYVTAHDIPLEILYEDEHITVINKPYNMPAHPSLGHRDDTAANALAARYSDKPYVFRPVNRLDRDTSGVMLTANTHLDAFKLYKSMIAGEIKKTYFAITDGILPERGKREAYMRLVDGSIVKRMECPPEDKGAKLAVTLWENISVSCGCTAVKITPVTGRTHQIRVCMASLGTPILGDTMYGRESSLITRQALHAYSLTFNHPVKGEMTLRAPIPTDISYAARELGFDLADVL